LVYTLEDRDLERIYRNMVLIREVELGISARYSEGQMRCPTHLSVGQESTPAVISAFTSDIDYAVSTHRSHAHYLAKGGDLVAMLAEIYGLDEGCSRGRGGSMHLADKNVGFMGSSAIVGNSIPVGTGLGMAAKLDLSNAISIIYLGDAAIEEGVFYESVNFSAVARLPVLFVCENNGFSVYTGFPERQPAEREIHEMVSALGVKSVFVSSYNISNLIVEARSAVQFVRESRAPFFLEVETARYLEHCGPNDDSHLGYRDVPALEALKKQDPLVALAGVLSSKGVDLVAIDSEIVQFVQDAFSQVETLASVGSAALGKTDA
jgi:TPP-dependent pyruvate/acetoin dehydrogenase alpha subunit